MARQGFRIAGLILFSPNTVPSGLSHTRKSNGPLDPMVDDAGDRQLAKQCFGDMSSDHPQVSPLLDDLSLSPTLHVEVGAQEVLFDDSVLLAQRAWDAGVAVTLHVQPRGLHMQQLWTPWSPDAVASLQRAATFADAVARQ